MALVRSQKATSDLPQLDDRRVDTQLAWFLAGFCLQLHNVGNQIIVYPVIVL